MTRHLMSWRHFVQFRHFLEAPLCRILAAFCKAAAIFRIDRAWNLSLDRDSLIGLGLIGSASGIADRSACVYGCIGWSYSSSVSAVSTIVPRYMTITRSEMYFTTLKSCAINK